VYLLLLPGEARVKLVGHGVEAEIEAAGKDLVELRAATRRRRRRRRYTRRAVVSQVRGGGGGGGIAHHVRGDAGRGGHGGGGGVSQPLQNVACLVDEHGELVVSVALPVSAATALRVFLRQQERVEDGFIRVPVHPPIRCGRHTLSVFSLPPSRGGVRACVRAGCAARTGKGAVPFSVAWRR
jgi:hypothetical protein